MATRCLDAPSHSFDGIYLIKTSTALKSRPHSRTIKSLLFSSNKFSLSSLFNSWFITSIFQKYQQFSVDYGRLWLIFVGCLSSTPSQQPPIIGVVSTYIIPYVCLAHIHASVLCSPCTSWAHLEVLKWKVCPAVAWSGGQRVDHLDCNTLCLNGGEFNE